jgi:DNA-binding transcriptional ArsR family regulator
MSEFRPAPSLTISDLDTLKVLADPLRHQILEVLTRETLPVKEIGARLGLTPGRLYYHVNLLEKHGLIQVVHTKMVSGIQEKHFRVSALDFEIDRGLLSQTTSQGRESIHSVLAATLDATRDDVLRSVEARFFELDRGAEEKPRNVIISRHKGNLTEAQVADFQARLVALVEDIEQAQNAAPEQGEGLHPYALLLAFYPSFYYSEAEGTEPG